MDDDVSSVDAPSPNAKIHGVLTTLSPMKKSRTCQYFDGELSDGKKHMRLFGFDSARSVRRKLEEFQGKDATIALSNCEVKRSRQGDSLEILIGKESQVDVSDKEFDASAIPNAKYGETISLDQLPDLEQFQRVSVTIKALRVDDPQQIPTGKMKQDIIIGDSTGTTRLTLWEEEIGSMDEDSSYQLKGVTVRHFRGKRFLSTSKGISCIIKADDIGSVDEQEEEDYDISDSTTSTVKNAQIVGVLDMQTYSSCVKCGSKVIPDEDDDDLCECVKCKMTQCQEFTQKHLSIRIMLQSQTQQVVLRAFGKTITDILQTPHIDPTKVTKSMLLRAEPFSLTYSGGIIQSTRR